MRLHFTLNGRLFSCYYKLHYIHHAIGFNNHQMQFFFLFIFLLKIYFNYFESIDNHLSMFSALSSALMIPNVLATGLSYCRRYKVFSHYIRWLRNHKCCWCLQMMSSISNSLLVIFRTGPHTPKCGSHLLLSCALFLLSFADDVQFIFSGT